MSSRRYITHSSAIPSDADLAVIESEIRKVVEENVARVDRHTHYERSSGHSTYSCYVGPLGSALMHRHLQHSSGRSSGPSASSKGIDTILHRVSLKLSPGKTSLSASHISFLETATGLATLGLLESSSSSSSSQLGEAVRFLRLAVNSAVSPQGEEDADDGCEVLYGRAGFLYALLLLRQCARKVELPSESDQYEFRSLVSDGTLRSVVHAIFIRGRTGARVYSTSLTSGSKRGRGPPPLMWSWHGKRYLGGAHGVAGILHMLLQCPKEAFDQRDMEDISRTIDWLVAIQGPDGNWPSKAPQGNEFEDGRNELVQWCHGATGIIILLSTFLEHPTTVGDHPSVRHALEKGADLVYRHGLLKKGLGLCHGVAGSVYALLAAATALDDRAYVMRAVHLAHLATTKDVKRSMATPDRPYSLYEGLAGMCCAWADVLRVIEAQQEKVPVGLGMPGFDDLGLYK